MATRQMKRRFKETAMPGNALHRSAPVGLMALALAGSVWAQGELRVNTGAASLSVFDGDRLVMEYCFDKVPFKPYAKQFLSPRGVNVLRDAPADHLHHHALMFAVAIDDVDFWAEAGPVGRQVHRSFAAPKLGSVGGIAAAAISEQLDWLRPGEDKPIAQESRVIEVYRDTSLGASLLTWRTTLAPPQGRPSIKVSGSHYFGLGMRFPASMDNVAEFLTADGKATGEVVRGDERLVPGKWCACSGQADGKPVTAVMFDHPDNVRPVAWFVMGKPFAYLSATLKLHKEPLVVAADKPLALCYGVAVWDGQPKADDIDKLYRRWLELVMPKP
jgi:hypothetical protein